MLRVVLEYQAAESESACLGDDQVRLARVVFVLTVLSRARRFKDHEIYGGVRVLVALSLIVDGA